MKNKKLILPIIAFVVMIPQFCFANFITIDQLKTYASSYQEYPDIDNDNWLNPDYSSFHKANLPGWFGTIMRFLGIYQKPVWSSTDFVALLEDVINERETNGYIGRFVQKFVPSPDSRFVIFGDLHGTFHSLTRDIIDLYEGGIIDQNYKIKDGYYLIFVGNTIDLSPFNLETLTLILQLMKVNPFKVFYIRGKHEDKEHWRNFGLRRELNVRAAGVVSEALITRFFETLPLALYLIGRAGKGTDVVRFSCFGRDYQELNEDTFADFFILDKKKKMDIRSLRAKQAQVSQTVDVKVIIKSEDRLMGHTTSKGLAQTDSDRGTTAWLVTSGPNRTFRSLYKFFFDAFAIVKTNGQIDNWTISLYNQDVREKLGITKIKEYNLVSGDEISVTTKREKTLEKQLTQVQTELKECQTHKKKTKEVIKKKPAIVKKEIHKKVVAIKQTKQPPVINGAKEIVIGTTIGLTGNIKEEAESVRLGLQLRIDEENRKGGVNGKKIRLIVLDDGYQPARARANVLELINKYKVDIILFPVGSATTKAYLDLVEKKKVVVLFSTSGSTVLRNPTPEYFVHFRPAYPEMYEALISYAQKNLDAKKFALVTQKDVSIMGLLETMKMAGVQQNNFIEVTHKRNITDMSKQAEQIKAFKPDAILFWTTSAASKALIKELGAANLVDTIMLGTDMRNPRFNAFLKTMGLSKNYIDAQALPNPETSQIPILKTYRAQMGNKPIDGLSAEAYVGASIFIYLLKKTGGTTNKEKIITASKNIKNLNLGGLELNYDKGRLSPFIWITTGKDWTAINVKKLEQKRERAAPTPKAPPKITGSEEEIVVGTTLGLTGNIKEESESIQLGLDLCIDQKNLTGGIAGKKIRLIVLDDGYQPERARANVLELINQHKVDIILIPTGSATTKAYLDLVEAKKVVVLFPSSGSIALRSPTPDYLIHFGSSYPAMFDALITYAKKNLGTKKFALVSQEDATTAGLKKTMVKAGISSDNLLEVTHKRNITEITNQAEQIKKFNPDAIIFWTTSAIAMEIIKEIGTENLINIKMLGVGLRDSLFNAFLKTIGLSSSYIDAQDLPNPETSQIPLLKEYRSGMGSRPIDGLSAEAYVCARIFFYLLKQTGGTTNKQEIIRAAEKINNLNLGGLKLHFDKKARQLSPFIWLTTGNNWTAINMNVREQKKESTLPHKNSFIKKGVGVTI